MSVDPLTARLEPKRDRWQRPLLVLPTGGPAVFHHRPSSLGGILEDQTNLTKWKMRQVAVGLSCRPDLALSVVAHTADRVKLNEITDDAMEAAGSSAGANAGTALHELTHQYMSGGLDLARVPEYYRPDLEAFADLVSMTGMAFHEHEVFGVEDVYRCAGRWDAKVSLPGRALPQILDLKTAQSMDFGMGKIAIQLAVYSRCVPYDIATDRRRPGLLVDQHVGLVLHLPSGGGKASLIEVDIQAGWEAVPLALAVRTWRARKDLSWPYAPGRPLTGAGSMDPVPDLIADAKTVDRLSEVWAKHHLDWTDEHTEFARARRAVIEAGL